MLAALYPSVEYRGLVIGNDAAGKTTILYKLKLGEVVTTIPTIGFNVEEMKYQGTSLTLWDVGGCDKIRPLWRHYYQNTQVIIYVVDSNDRDRMVNPDPVNNKYHVYADSGLTLLLEEEELKNAILLIFANKQDLPNSVSVEDIREALQLDRLLDEDQVRWGCKRRSCHVVGCTATTGDGLYEGLDWIVATFRNSSNSNDDDALPPPPPPLPHDSSSSITTTTTTLTAEQKESMRLEALVLEWLSREDLSDEDFLQQLVDATLDVWDHYTHLRIAWLHLSQYGRREGMEKIFTNIRSFIEISPRTKRSDTSRGTTFHETMTYFWTHMVHYAMCATANIDGKFKTFILMNPQLANGGLFLHYYSKKLMLLNAEARSSVLLPDIVPLPSIIASWTSGRPSSTTPIHLRLQPRKPLTDDEFLDAVRSDTVKRLAKGEEGDRSEGEVEEPLQLMSWGHDIKIRLIYLLLVEQMRQGVRRNVDAVFDILKAIEKDNFHLTITYFWIQIISNFIAVIRKRSNQTSAIITSTSTSSSTTSATYTNDMDFETFYRQPECQKLRNSLLYEKYYSRSVIDDKSAAVSFRLSDLKYIPSVI